ncbi:MULTISPECIES: hydroxymethylglutaryl-CoA lyase [unclassified Burkholderia]|uniref:hydroxymethylglutaryl-CoA lyase n=1 Tax=unclassified Burkholderia TaxID=2613784 RepID=UPI000F59B113|nr:MULTISPECIES: hydroxymethylglutaryl-CoA lyase [unclassified Burkholderia]RQS19124.1 hydroxymethylglutaryl-CoA lyase [Burkholderia sp. Bp8995]RQS38885.1 hydroxymethylglutaryl-CoA lyase [Burkholderia sp. Bp8989]
MATSNGRKLHVHDVCVRDGFQMESVFVPTNQKVSLIDRLSRTGLAKIEVTSFSSPKAIPALADAEEVLASIERIPGVEYTALVPNIRGCERALRSSLDEINVVMSASETHNRANLRMTREQSLEQLAEMTRLAGTEVAVNASLSTAFGCPFDGQIGDSDLLRNIERIASSGIKRLTLCDTTGMANPQQVRHICDLVLSRFHELTVTAHFHNTRGMGLANCLAALEAGITRFDASLAGLGGCPFAPGASGNVCTEDMVHMFNAMGFNTGVNVSELIQLALEIPSLVGHGVPGQVMKAGPYDRVYAKPEWLDAGRKQTRIVPTSRGSIDPECNNTEAAK